MKISIITVVYNSANTISDCIRSVVAQTYQNIEYIVIDGHSTDGTQEVIESFGSSVHIYKSEPDKGIYDAMNKGIELATGDLIGTLNADDFYSDSSIIEKVARNLQHNKVDGLYGDLIFVNPDNLNKAVRTWRSGQYSKHSFLFGWMPPHPTFFLKKTFYEQFGKFRLDMGSAADYELMLRMVYKNKARLNYLPEILVVMRTGGVSTSSLKNRLNANKKDRRAWKVNGLKPYFFSVWLKPLRKIFQFIT